MKPFDQDLRIEFELKIFECFVAMINDGIYSKVEISSLRHAKGNLEKWGYLRPDEIDLIDRLWYAREINPREINGQIL